MIFRGSVLVVALLVNAPTIWDAFGRQTVSVTTALVHYLVAVPIVAVLLGLVRYAARPPLDSPPVDAGPDPAS